MTAKISQTPDGGLIYENGKGTKFPHGNSESFEVDQSLIHVLTDIRERLSAHTVILNEVFKPDIDEIKTTLKEQTVQSISFDKRLISVEGKTEGIILNCVKIQDQKSEDLDKKAMAREKFLDNRFKRSLRLISLIGLIVTIITAANGIFNGGTRIRGQKAYEKVEKQIDTIDHRISEITRGSFEGSRPRPQGLENDTSSIEEISDRIEKMLNERP